MKVRSAEITAHVDTMEKLSGIDEIALPNTRASDIAPSSDNDDFGNVSFPPLSETEITEAATSTNARASAMPRTGARSTNVSMLAAVSSICDNPHAQPSGNFAMYSYDDGYDNDTRFGPIIDGYEPKTFSVLADRGWSPTPDYRGFALKSNDDGVTSPSDIGAELDDVNRQLASLSSDVSELKSTIENMVNDVTGTAQDSRDAVVLLKTIEATFDSLAETVYEMKQVNDARHEKDIAWQKSVDEWRERVDARLAELSKQ